MQKEDKRQKLEEIAQQEGISAALWTDVLSTPSILDPKSLEKESLRNNQI